MQRFKATKVASFLGIFFNLFLFVIKFITSLLTSSQAMLADAINSLGDIFSSLMTLIGNKIASKPSDDDHNLGHGKAEYIYSLLISIVIMIVAVTLFKDSLESIIFKSASRLGKKSFPFSSLFIYPLLSPASSESAFAESPALCLAIPILSIILYLT